jgi:intracellular sulfur oxidation DsrE/DsrF family protein
MNKTMIRRLTAMALAAAAMLANLPLASARADDALKSPSEAILHFTASHKIVFDFNSPELSPAEPNPGLVAIADLLNTFKQQGTKAANLHIVVVMHGAATELVLDSAAYRQKKNVEQGNPNLALMQQLSRDGVLFVVSKKSLTAKNIAEADLQPMVKIGPTADLVFFNFEENGYVYTGTKGLSSE